MSRQVQVQRFWLQPAKSYPQGAPQREDYLNERAFDRACVSYADEWRQAHRCAGRCGDIGCPQCGAQRASFQGVYP